MRPFEQLSDKELTALYSAVRHDLDQRYPHPDEEMVHSLKSKLEEELRTRRPPSILDFVVRGDTERVKRWADTVRRLMR